MSGPVRTDIVFDAIAAKRKIDDYLQEYYSDPMHWTNNKRRRMGMRPLRKPVNRRGRSYPDGCVIQKIIDESRFVGREMSTVELVLI